MTNFGELDIVFISFICEAEEENKKEEEHEIEKRYRGGFLSYGRN